MPDAFGGNMDTPEMQAGVTCYLGVNVPGALLSIGDGHARQGEGETCGVAVECAMNTVVVVDLLKGVATPWPRLESDTHIMSAGSARPLEDAFRVAQLDLVQWVAGHSGLSVLDAYQFLSQAVEAPLANVVDTNYTSVAKLRKDWLPGDLAVQALAQRSCAARTPGSARWPGPTGAGKTLRPRLRRLQTCLRRGGCRRRAGVRAPGRPPGSCRPIPWHCR